MVSPVESFRQAWASLTAHKLRSLLTLLGLIIAVSSLILVMTLVQGANAYVQEKIANLGVNVFEITKLPQVPIKFEDFLRAFRHRDLTRDHWRALAAGCRRCLEVGAAAQTTGRVHCGGRNLTDIQIYGQSANVSLLSTLDVVAGRYFTDGEDRQGARVLLLGHRVTEKCFSSADPVGQRVRVGGDEFSVVGALEEVGSVLGQEQDNYVILPLGTFERLYGAHHSLTLKVQAASAAALPAAVEEAHALLRRQRGLRSTEADDFFVTTADTYLQLWHDISSVFFLVFVLISAVASVVGGIVITNIMLVSVKERTKEIGIRRSVGASQRDILGQFLLEALGQCLVGGGLGVLLGFLGALILSQLTPFPAAVKSWVALAGLSLSVVIGLVFGLYPAVQAARLDPAAALRSE
jgi:putative ABC transport system permease protein